MSGFEKPEELDVGEISFTRNRKTATETEHNMTTLPHPLTIAREIVEGYELDEDLPNADLDSILTEVEQKIAAAIEADRAQRAEIHQDWS